MKISVKSRKSRNSNLVLRLRGAVKTSVAILRLLQKTRNLALTRKSCSWRRTAKDSYINDTTMAV